ncbi:hypothetical protein EV421DRAFT_1906321 [Armillaria borealis]|uniref:Uncharacterized protein n=1 Tax=Armillaria borealis TaxID=47425 RepID=A0AA39JA40_9AGAR|nr:hypothetical protein EV421DRAFT_1906321 [Armillaria borealis]
MADLNMATVVSLSGRVGLVTAEERGRMFLESRLPRLIVDSDRGFVIAKVFGANGSKVYITVCRLDVLEEAAEPVAGVPGSVVPDQMDVADEESEGRGQKVPVAQ